MRKKITQSSKQSQKASDPSLGFFAALVWALCIPTVYLAISINVQARSFNVKKMTLPFFGECQMMELLFYGTTIILPCAILAIHLLYWLYQRHAKNENDRMLRLPSSLGAMKVPPAYRNQVSLILAVAVVVLPVISYVDLAYQMQKYCRIVPARATNVLDGRQIAESDTLGGAGLLQFPLKRPGSQSDSDFYWINHYKPETIEAGKSGKAGLVKVSALPLQPLAIALFALGSVVSMGLIFWRAKA